MTIFELIQQEVSAKQAAELYGLRFDGSGRGFCPWHDDGRHAALQFFEDGGCYCHSCHQHGDATALVAQMLGIPENKAAWQIKRDFHLDQPVDRRSKPSTQARQRREDAKQAAKNRWSQLCDVVREADARLAQYTPETIDSEFDLILGAKCQAELELDLMWEELRCERTRRIHSK